MPVWITDRGPHSDELNTWGEALVTTAVHAIKIAVWDKDHWEVCDPDYACNNKVIAWMPLPAEYREDM